ncbi:MAG: outer membrane lipoprotein-sorting protein [Bacteroidota bacterium]
MIKKTLLPIILFLCSVSVIKAQTVDEIATKHVAALGGAEKLRAIKTITMDNTIGVQGMEFENKMTIVIGKAMRSESKVMGSEMVQAFDGQNAWAIMPSMMGGSGEPEAMPDEMAKGVAGQTDAFPFLDYVDKGTKIELVGTEKVKDNDAYHLKVTKKDGSQSEYWIGVANNLISKVKSIQNGQEAEIYFSNHKEVEGVNFSMSMETSNPMAGTITVDTKAVTINGMVDESIFKMPAKK